jgi:hypothetical protein
VQKSSGVAIDWAGGLVGRHRAVTNFSGNAVAVGVWTTTLDRARMAEVPVGKNPFDEQNMVDDHPGNRDRSDTTQRDDHGEPAQA